MNIAIISCSLNPNSSSYVLAQTMQCDLQAMNIQVDLHDLRQYDIQFCDGTAESKTPDLATLKAAIEVADAVLVAVPVYNYDVNAAAKNLVEQAGSSWTNKIVGFMCAAGGNFGYMSVLGIANSLMLDYRCLIIPRFVYASRSDFNSEDGVKSIGSDSVRERMDELAERTVTLAKALSS